MRIIGEPTPARVLGVGAVIVDGPRILLVLRRHDPQAGRWSIPGGKVDPGEGLVDAVIREVAEETGLVVEVGEEAWVVDIPDGPVVYEVHDFFVRVVGPEGVAALRAGSDAADVAWLRRDELDSVPVTTGLLHYLDEFVFGR